MDKITKERRSWNMSRIRGKNTRPEILVRKFLHGQGVRYRLHVKLPGRPDVAIRKKKIAVFINGCFWHAHDDCPDFRWPKTRSEFWKDKINGNVARDQDNYDQLKGEGWQVIVVWECDLKRNTVATLQGLYQSVVSPRF